MGQARASDSASWGPLHRLRALTDRSSAGGADIAPLRCARGLSVAEGLALPFCFAAGGSPEGSPTLTRLGAARRMVGAAPRPVPALLLAVCAFPHLPPTVYRILPPDS